MKPIHAFPSIFFLISTLLSTHIRLDHASGFLHYSFFQFFSLISHSCHTFRSSHSRRFDHLNNTLRILRIMNVLKVQFSPVSCHFTPHRLKQEYLLQHSQSHNHAKRQKKFQLCILQTSCSEVSTANGKRRASGRNGRKFPGIVVCYFLPFMNSVSVCLRSFQIFYIRHICKGLINFPYVVVLPCFMFKALQIHT
jgi:hypothetical protein